MPRHATKPDADPRQKLLEAAVELFARRGYEGATVRDICDRAGMNVAAVSYHFGDKERLYVEALKYAHVCSFEGPLPEPPAGATPADKLRGFIAAMAARMHVPVSPTATQLVMRELAHPGKAGEAVVREHIQPLAFRLRDVLRELLPGADERKLLMVGFSVISQILFYRQNRRVAELIFGKEAVAALGVEAVTEHVTRFTFAALGLAPPINASGAGGKP
jgi:AcrR family transcriptional regulator